MLLKRLNERYLKAAELEALEASLLDELEERIEMDACLLNGCGVDACGAAGCGWD